MDLSSLLTGAPRGAPRKDSARPGPARAQPPRPAAQRPKAEPAPTLSPEELASPWREVFRDEAREMTRAANFLTAGLRQQKPVEQMREAAQKKFSGKALVHIESALTAGGDEAIQAQATDLQKASGVLLKLANSGISPEQATAMAKDRGLAHLASLIEGICADARQAEQAAPASAPTAGQGPTAPSPVTTDVAEASEASNSTLLEAETAVPYHPAPQTAEPAAPAPVSAEQVEVPALEDIPTEHLLSLDGLASVSAPKRDVPAEAPLEQADALDLGAVPTKASAPVAMATEPELPDAPALSLDDLQDAGPPRRAPDESAPAEAGLDLSELASKPLPVATPDPVELAQTPSALQLDEVETDGRVVEMAAKAAADRAEEESKRASQTPPAVQKQDVAPAPSPAPTPAAVQDSAAAQARPKPKRLETVLREHMQARQFPAETVSYAGAIAKAIGAARRSRPRDQVYVVIHRSGPYVATATTEASSAQVAKEDDSVFDAELLEHLALNGVHQQVMAELKGFGQEALSEHTDLELAQGMGAHFLERAIEEGFPMELARQLQAMSAGANVPGVEDELFALELLGSAWGQKRLSYDGVLVAASEAQQQ